MAIAFDGIIDFRFDIGAGAHQTHVSFENVKNLGEFVNAGLSQYFPQAGDAGVFLEG